MSNESTSTAAVGTTAEHRPYRKTRRGYVVSDKMQKTVVVEVEDRVKHPLYGKVLRRTSKVKAHDEANTAGSGDLVLIMETRPLSATKRWRVVEILETAK
jgi:small subunit ribosomal protein S17